MGNKISENIRKHRKIFGETQAQLAKYLGVSKTAISNYEKDLRQLSLDDLEKLSEHYLTTTDDLLKSTTPEFTLEWFDLDYYCKQIGVMFPAFGHTAIMEKGNDESFIAAVSTHRKFLDCISILYDDEADETILEEDIDLNMCRENYLRAIQKEKYNIYCKANLVGLFFVLAMMVNSVKYTKEIPESVLIGLSGDPEMGRKSKEGWDKRKAECEPVFNAMRDKHSMEMLDKYLEDLSQNDALKDLAEYYRCGRYILNLVDNDDGRVANYKHGFLRMIECGDSGNLYASICILIFENAVKIGPP